MLQSRHLRLLTRALGSAETRARVEEAEPVAAAACAYSAPQTLQVRNHTHWSARIQGAETHQLACVLLRLLLFLILTL